MISFLLVFISFCVNADEKNILQGNMNVGGSASYNYTTSNNYYFSVSPSFQYFVSDRLSVGPVISHSQTSSSFNYAAGATGSFYFGENGPIVFNLTQSILYSVYKPKGYSWSLDDVTATTALGYFYFLNKHTSVGPSFGVRYYLNKENQGGVTRADDDTTTFLNINFNIFI